MGKYRFHRLSLWGGKSYKDVLYRRIIFLLGVLVVFFLGLLIRLWQVQIRQNDEHIHNARRQSLRPVRLNAVRGRIFASDGTLLVENIARYDLVFYISEMRQPGRLKNTIDFILECEKRIAETLGRESTLTEKAVKRQLHQRPVLPMNVFRNLSVEERTLFGEMLPRIPGAEIMARAERTYPQGNVLPHVLGKTGIRMPSGADIMEEWPRFYVTADVVGLNGLEASYNSELAGKAGARTIVVDSVGYARDVFDEGLAPVPGHDLYLTIDLKAQRVAERLLEGYDGALVAVDVRTGAVLAMASAPDYDLATMSMKEYNELSIYDPEQRKLNRCLRGTYTPGSIMKPLLALAALEMIPEEVNQEYDCSGIYMLNDKVGIRCGQRFGHGPLTLEHAMAVSCNPFFINLGVKLGIDRYSEFLRSAGIGEKTGIELGESRGILPERPFARKAWKRRWILPDTAFVSIGQGPITVTPMQAAMFTAAIANGGQLLRPYLVKEIRKQDGSLVKVTEPRVRHRLDVSEENIRHVRRSMEDVVNLYDGGAKKMQAAGIPMAAKTGTAEVASGQGNLYKNTWVISYGPADAPQIAVVCVIEHGNSGADTAVPLATEFVKQYYTADEEVPEEM